jgi:hypothetical protein
MKTLLTLTLSFFMLSCSQVQRYENVSKPTGVRQTVSLGSELYRINKTRDLPNAFGKADVWGGEINEGYSELRFMGLTEQGKIIFRLTDIDVESNESVFTRYGVNRTTINSNTTANVRNYGNTVYGSVNTNTTISHIDKPVAIITQLPPNTIEFIFDANEKVLRLDTLSIEVFEVTPQSISYVIYKL